MVDVITEYGTDINSDWSFKDGDILIVSDKDNLSQGILNRLNTFVGSLNLFYLDYGSFLLSYLGWKRTDSTLEFIKLEVETVLAKDPRINNFSVDASYDPNGSVRIELSIIYNDGEDFSLNYVLDNEGIQEVEV